MVADNLSEVAVSHKSLYDLLEYEEGKKDKIYLDIKGIPTGGIGHAFHVGSKLPKKIWHLIFLNDTQKAWRYFDTLELNHLSIRRQWVCVAMIFQLGFAGFCGFKNTIAFLRQENYKEAAREMLDSKWAKIDTPNRALRMSKMMIDG